MAERQQNGCRVHVNKDVTHFDPSTFHDHFSELHVVVHRED